MHQDNVLNKLTPRCNAMFLGSMPGKDHFESLKMILNYSPHFPCWPQLPEYEEENILQQFLSGLPGIREENGNLDFLLTDTLEEEIKLFEVEAQAVLNGSLPQENSRFILESQRNNGFHVFLHHFTRQHQQTIRLKGQIIGPLTLCLGIRDQEGQPLLSRPPLRDCVVKLIGLKAAWQTRQLAQLHPEPIVFLDEPMLLSLRNSVPDGMTFQSLQAMLNEIVMAIKDSGGKPGIHVCAPTDWGFVLSTGVEIISFDAYSHFDSLMDYPGDLGEFLQRGGLLASGIVPTSPLLLPGESVESLTTRWLEQASRILSLGFSMELLYSNSFITPSCGTGRLEPHHAGAVMKMTRDVASELQAMFKKADEQVV